MANLSFNQVVLCGRLTANPELRTTNGGTSVTSFRIAVNRRSREVQTQADFIDVVAWKERGENIAKYFTKGDSIFIVGELQTREWTDKQGGKRTTVEVVVSDFRFVDSKSEKNAPSVVPGYQPQTQLGAMNTPKFEDVNENDDLPF